MTDTPSLDLRGDIEAALYRCPPEKVLAFEATRGTWAVMLNTHCPNYFTPLGAKIRRSIGGEDYMAWSFPARADEWAALLGVVIGATTAPAGIEAEAHRASTFEACRAKGHGDANAYEFEDTAPNPKDLPGQLRAAGSASRRAQAYAIAALLDRGASEIERLNRLLSPGWDATPPCVGLNPGEQIGTGTPAPDSVSLEPGAKLPPSFGSPGALAQAIRQTRLSPRLPENVAALLEAIAKAVENIVPPAQAESARGFAPDRFPEPPPSTVRSLLRSMRDVLEAVRTRPVSVEEVRSLLVQIEEALGPQADTKPDDDGLVHFTSITSQEQLRRIVSTSFANGRQREINDRFPTFAVHCTARGLDPKATTLEQLLTFVHEQGKAESWHSQNKVGFGFHIDRRTWDSLAPDLRRHVEDLFSSIAGVVSVYQMTFAAVPREESGWGAATIILPADEKVPASHLDPVEDAKAYVAQARAGLDPKTVLHHRV